jgi:hypothetical protein
MGPWNQESMSHDGAGDDALVRVWEESSSMIGRS